MSKLVLPLLAVFGAAGAALVWLNHQSVPPQAKPFAEPAQAPFEAYVSASGLIESPTANLAVAAPVSGIVKRFHVKVGQQVRAGDPLFQLDDAAKRAELARQQTSLALAERKLDKLELGTRPEELASQEAQVAQARVSLEEARRQFQLRQKLADARLVSADEVMQQAANVRAKEEQLNFAAKQWELLKAGSWQPDVEIAMIEAAGAKSQMAQTQVELDQMTVRAPISGEILRINVHPGELASSVGPGQPLILLGETRKLNIRAEVDENDAWRVEQSRPALAFPRGRRDVSIPLRFVRIEPYVSPKRNLTGESAERVDTRVLAVIYELQNPPIRVFVGQQMDVYIQAQGLPDKASAPSAQDRKESRK